MPELSTAKILRRSSEGTDPTDTYEELPTPLRPTVIRSSGRSQAATAVAPERSSTSVTIRFLSTNLTRSITSSDRILWDGRIYEIAAVNALPRTCRQIELVLNGV